MLSIVQQIPVLAQKFVQSHSAGGGYIEGMLGSKHGDSDEAFTAFEQFGSYTVDLMTEH